MKDLIERAQLAELGQHRPVARHLLEDQRAEEVVAFLLKSFFHDQAKQARGPALEPAAEVAEATVPAALAAPERPAPAAESARQFVSLRPAETDEGTGGPEAPGRRRRRRRRGGRGLGAGEREASLPLERPALAAVPAPADHAAVLDIDLEAALASATGDDGPPALAAGRPAGEAVAARGRRERQDRPERSERRDGPDRLERSARHGRPEPQGRVARAERSDRAERPDRHDRPERHERADRHDRPERHERAERLGGDEPRRRGTDAAAPAMPAAAAVSWPATPAPIDPGAVLVRINVGVRDGFKGIGQVAKKVAGLAGIADRLVREVVARADHTIVQAEPQVAETVLDRVDGAPLGKKVLRLARVAEVDG